MLRHLVILSLYLLLGPEGNWECYAQDIHALSVIGTSLSGSSTSLSTNTTSTTSTSSSTSAPGLSLSTASASAITSGGTISVGTSTSGSTSVTPTSTGTGSSPSPLWMPLSQLSTWASNAASTGEPTTSTGSPTATTNGVSLTSSAASGTHSPWPSVSPVPGYSGTFTAPHRTIYADLWTSTMPDVSLVEGYNRFIMGFWMPSGAQGFAAFWPTCTNQSAILDQYHQAGIAVMISAFGQTFLPTTAGADPSTTAQQLASFVKQYNFDGVDIDYEDLNAMNNGTAEPWLVAFHTELRQQLGTSYLISHAPLAPWFSQQDYTAGAYSYIYSQVPDIDFFNIQYYNQPGVYGDCTSLISNSTWNNTLYPGTSILEINEVSNVPMDKLLLGKPLQTTDARSGYMDPASLAPCYQQGIQGGWTGGMMLFEYNTSADAVGALSTIIGK